MLKKTSRKSEIQTESQIVPVGLQPRTEVALLYSKDGQPCWVRGYEIFDPTLVHSTTKGAMPLKPKSLRPKHVYVIQRGQQGTPMQRPLKHIAAVQPGKHYFTFPELFGQSGGDIISVSVATTEEDEYAEDEDLNLLGDEVAIEEED